MAVPEAGWQLKFLGHAGLIVDSYALDLVGDDR